MQVTLTVFPNIFERDNYTKEVLEFSNLLDLLKVKYPNGFKYPVNVYVNSRLIEINDFDYTLKDQDIVIIAYRPAADPLTFGVVGAWVINFAIAAAVSIIVGKIFAPNMPEAQSYQNDKNQNQSSVYSLNNNQNSFRKGELIPIIYGKVRLYPSLLEAPYYKYEDNEQYLYLLMAIGQGKYSIDDVLISDSSSKDIHTDTFVYKQLEEDSFENIEDAIDDENYTQRVRTVEEIRDLTIRGTPEENSFILRFENNQITFYDNVDGTKPDLSALAAGSIITISSSRRNNGDYTVVSVDNANNIVTIQETLVLEPSVVDNEERESVDNDTYFIAYPSLSRILRRQYIGSIAIDTNISTIENSIFFLTGVNQNNNIEYYNTGFLNKYTTVKPAPLAEDTPIFANQKIIINYVAFLARAKFETSYGQYQLNTKRSGRAKDIEIDLVFPAGIYSSQTDGTLVNRTVSVIAEVLTYRFGIDEPIAIDETVLTYQDRTNTPLRFTESLNYTEDDNAIYKLRIKRDPNYPESDNVRDQDSTILERIKYLEEVPNSKDFGNITLLWTKAKATNGLSSIGQFKVNAWVIREDVENDLKSVLEDVYTNTDYGAKLSINDLIIPYDTNARVNGAIDTSLSVLETMQMIAKANRYQVFLKGSKVEVKKDTLRPIRSMLFNETNIIKGSLSINYIFKDEAEQKDGIEILYRDPETFEILPIIYPEDAIFPEEIELFGCTDMNIARKMAEYTWKMYESRRVSITFETDIQGIIPEFMDRIAFGHSMPLKGLSGRVSKIDGNIIDFDCRLPIFQEGYSCDHTFECSAIFCYSVRHNYITFIDDKGAPSDELSFTALSQNQIEMIDPLPTWVYDGYEKDKTPFLMVKEEVSDYIVTSIKPMSGNKVKIEAINYDDTVYFGDLLIDPAGNILTDGSLDLNV